jgi:RimJ/RimL family protein N-acetyltransferase
VGGPDRWVGPVTLEGRFVRLEPLSLDHVPGLAEVGLDPEIWRWMPAPVTSVSEMRSLIEAALAEAEAGRQVPFGSTRFLNIEPEHRRLEIGWTWLARPWQRTAINSEAKLLLMEHAFGQLGALRVEFKTDARNEQSRRALAGIGATEEGTLRQHMLTAAGRRDSVYFSVIADEWPQVRHRLEERLGR